VALVGRHRPDAQQVPAGCGAGHRWPGVDPWHGYEHPVRIEVVLLDHPLPRPPARRHHDVHRAQHLSLGLRHVQQEHEMQPLGLRHDHLGRRGHQPVDQHGRPVREPGDINLPGHSVLVNLPAGRDELLHEAPVVDVPAAGPLWVVDRLGYDEVEGHSTRS
jgi:hypothetical protein